MEGSLEKQIGKGTGIKMIKLQNTKLFYVLLWCDAMASCFIAFNTFFAFLYGYFTLIMKVYYILSVVMMAPMFVKLRKSHQLKTNDSLFTVLLYLEVLFIMIIIFYSFPEEGFTDDIPDIIVHIFRIFSYIVTSTLWMNSILLIECVQKQKTRAVIMGLFIFVFTFTSFLPFYNGLRAFDIEPE